MKPKTKKCANCFKEKKEAFYDTDIGIVCWDCLQILEREEQEE